jgi:tetratricopeptide (TPR) repeat protein
MDTNELRDRIVTRNDYYIFVATPEGLYAFDRNDAGTIQSTTIFMSIDSKSYKPGEAGRAGGKLVGTISDDAKRLFTSIGVTGAYECEIAQEKRVAGDIRRNPNDPAAYYNRAHLALGKNDDDQAIEDFTRAIQLNQNYADAYFFRAAVYAKRQNYGLAAADYEMLVGLKPDNFSYRKSLEEMNIKIEEIKADQRKRIVKFIIPAAVTVAVFFLLRACVSF